MIAGEFRTLWCPSILTLRIFLLHTEPNFIWNTFFFAPVGNNTEQKQDNKNARRAASSRFWKVMKCLQVDVSLNNSFYMFIFGCYSGSCKRKRPWITKLGHYFLFYGWLRRVRPPAFHFWCGRRLTPKTPKHLSVSIIFTIDWEIILMLGGFGGKPCRAQ